MICYYSEPPPYVTKKQLEAEPVRRWFFPTVKMCVTSLFMAAALTAAAVANESKPLVALESLITLEAGHAQAALLMPIVAPTKDVRISAKSENERIAISNVIKTIPAGDQSGDHVPIFGKHPGSTTVKVTLESQHEELSGSKHIHVDVIRSFTLIPWITGLGWLCFFLWSSSFYPQVFENQRRNSVIGLNLDSALWYASVTPSHDPVNLRDGFSLFVFP